MHRALPRWIPALALVLVLLVALPTVASSDAAARATGSVLDQGDDAPGRLLAAPPSDSTLVLAWLVVTIVSLLSVALRAAPSARLARLRAPPTLLAI